MRKRSTVIMIAIFFVFIPFLVNSQFVPAIQGKFEEFKNLPRCPNGQLPKVDTDGQALGCLPHSDAPQASCGFNHFCWYNGFNFYCCPMDSPGSGYGYGGYGQQPAINPYYGSPVTTPEPERSQYNPFDNQAAFLSMSFRPLGQSRPVAQTKYIRYVYVPVPQHPTDYQKQHMITSYGVEPKPPGPDYGTDTKPSGYDTPAPPAPTYNEGYGKPAPPAPTYNEGYDTPGPIAPPYNEGYDTPASPAPTYNKVTHSLERPSGYEPVKPTTDYGPPETERSSVYEPVNSTTHYTPQRTEPPYEPLKTTTYSPSETERSYNPRPIDGTPVGGYKSKQDRTSYDPQPQRGTEVDNYGNSVRQPVEKEVTSEIDGYLGIGTTKPTIVVTTQPPTQQYVGIGTERLPGIAVPAPIQNPIQQAPNQYQQSFNPQYLPPNRQNQINQLNYFQQQAQKYRRWQIRRLRWYK